MCKADLLLLMGTLGSSVTIPCLPQRAVHITVFVLRTILDCYGRPIHIGVKYFLKEHSQTDCTFNVLITNMCNFFSKIYLLSFEGACRAATAIMQGRRKQGGAGGALAPQFLAKQLTLSQPGGQIMPTTVILATALKLIWDLGLIHKI